MLSVNLGGGLAAAGAGLGAGLLFGIPLIPPGAARAAPAGCGIKCYYATLSGTDPTRSGSNPNKASHPAGLATTANLLSTSHSQSVVVLASVVRVEELLEPLQLMVIFIRELTSVSKPT